MKDPYKAVDYRRATTLLPIFPPDARYAGKAPAAYARADWQPLIVRAREQLDRLEAHAKSYDPAPGSPTLAGDECEYATELAFVVDRLTRSADFADWLLH